VRETVHEKGERRRWRRECVCVGVRQGERQGERMGGRVRGRDGEIYMWRKEEINMKSGVDRSRVEV
jgi:hypothetical protein